MRGEDIPDIRIFSLIFRFPLLLSDVQSSVISDVFSRFKTEFTEINHFRSVIHDSNARIAAISALDKEIDTAWQLPPLYSQHSRSDIPSTSRSSHLGLSLHFT
jgi:hypothetical protein